MAERHHSVPNFFLRRFATPPDKPHGSWQLSAYDRQTGLVIGKTATISVAVENDLYKIHSAKGADQYRIERELSDLEHAAERTFARVVQKKIIDREDIQILRDFIGVTYARTTSYRERIIRMGGEFIRTHGVDDLRREGPPEGAPDGFRQFFWEHLNKVESGEVRLEEDPDFAIQTQFPLQAGFVLGLSEGWNHVVVYSPQPRILTSDVPVVTRHMHTGGYGVIPDIGLANAAEIWMPFDPNHSLLLTRDFGSPRWIANLPASDVRA